MTTSSEKLSRIVSEAIAYHFPDTKPTVGQVVTVLATGIDQVNLGFSNVALPDPIAGFTLYPAANTIEIALASGTKFPLDLTPILDDTKLTAAADTAVGEIGFTLSDGSAVTYTATLNHPNLKADKTTKVTTATNQVTLTNPTFADDIAIDLKVGTNAGDLVALVNANELPPTVIAYMQQTLGFVTMPALHDPTGGAAPAGQTNDMIWITRDGVMDYVNLNGVFQSGATVHVGDILFYGADNRWHMFTRAQTRSLPASSITVNTIGTPTLGTNAQQALQSLEDRKVPDTRNIISTDVNELRVNGLVQDDMDLDITLDLVTNTPNGIVKLDAAGQVPLSLMPTSALQFHGSMPANSVNAAATRPSGDPWQSGDTILINADGNADVIKLGDTTVTAGVALKSGQTIIRNTTNQWVVAAVAGIVNSSDVNISPALGGAHLTQTQLNALLQYIDNNAVWITSNQTVAGDKTLTGQTTAQTLRVGGTGTEFTFPATRSLNADYTLVTDATGTVRWDKLPATSVSMTLATVAGSDVEAIVTKLFNDVMLQQQPAVGKTLHRAGDGTAGITLTGAADVLMGDGVTPNQISNVIFDEGRI